MYDGSGLIGFKRNGTTYTYVFNGLGDVMEILDSSGNAVVSYLYDAWGAPISITGPMASTLGVQNPIRYRGYYYDTETGLYYINSRYYDPVVGRFINADGYVSTGQGLLGHNMFVYCGNNPVNNMDSTGRFWGKVGDWFKKAGDSVSKFVNKVVNCVSQSFSAKVEVGSGFGYTKKNGIANTTVEAIGIGTEWGYDCKSKATYSRDKSSAAIKVEVIEDVGVGADVTYSAPTSATEGKGLMMNPEAEWEGKIGAYAFNEGLAIQINPGDQDIELAFGLGAYFILGGGFEVSFNINEFIRQWDEAA